MGTAGTDVAIETADVTLMNDDLLRVVEFMEMSKKVLASREPSTQDISDYPD
jgi:cation transport ATPase